MRILVLCLVVFTSQSFAKRHLQNDDIIRSRYLRMNIDGLESWDIHPDVREEKIEEFKIRCLKNILGRAQKHERDLAALYRFFNLEDYQRVHKVHKIKTQYGDQYLCQAEIKVKKNASFAFKAKYSKIFKDRVNGTMELCRKKIESIDDIALKKKIFTRRAYFSYKRRACDSCPTYPKCQTLKVFLKKKN